MPTVADFVAALATEIPSGIAASWDPVGLQLGNPGATVDSIAVCHEVTEEVVLELESAPVDLLVTYHPLLFAPVNRLLHGRSPAARALRLIEAGINLLVTHTDFDAAPGGAADALADALGLDGVGVLGVEDLDGSAEIGRVGSYRGNLGDLAETVRAALGVSALRLSGDPMAGVTEVAVIPGSGSDFVEAALGSAQALVTGDVGHHRCVRALDAGLGIVDPGHVATERPGMRSLVAKVRAAASCEVTDLTHLDPQTWI